MIHWTCAKFPAQGVNAKKVKCDGRTDGQTNGQTNGLTDGPTKRGVGSRSTRLKSSLLVIYDRY